MGNPNRSAVVALAALAAAAVALTVWEWAQHGLSPLAFLPAGILLVALAAWPLLTGWRPVSAARRLRSCDGCGTQWRPVDEGGTLTCPVCT